MCLHCFFIFSWVLFFCWQAEAQSVEKELVVHCSDAEFQLLKKYPVNKSVSGEAAAKHEVFRLIAVLQKDGYFTAKADALSKQGNQFITTISVGKQFIWARLSVGSLSPLLQDKTGFRGKFYLDQPFHYEEVGQLMENVLQHAENTGYPFASIRLTDISLTEGEISASLDYQAGPFITFGHLHVNDSSLIKPGFLAAYLGIKAGSAYQQKKVDAIESLVSELPYLSLEQPIRTTFQNESADIYLELSKKKSNQIDGVISFLPNEGKGGKLLLTGEVNLLLNNLFHAGKTLSFQWQRLQVQSQELTAHYAHPNLLKSPLDVSLGFDFLKQDTLFVNRDFRADFSFRKNAFSKIGVYANFRSSRLLSHQGASLPAETISEYADFNLNSYGIKYTWRNLDHLLFPIKGMNFSLEGSVGNKKLKDTVPDNAAVPSQTWQYMLLGTLSYYRPLGKSVVLFQRLQGGTMQSEQLFMNDLWRIGGLHSLRGFNEKFFYVSSYALSNLELRLLFDRQQEEHSYLFVFYDQSYISREGYTDYPLGVGAGISLVTKTGVFNLAYALGKTKEQPLDLSLSKIHFGYISRF